MASKPDSAADSQFPEVIENTGPTHNVYDSSYEYFMPQRSPAPEYQAYAASPPLSASSPRLSSSSPPPQSGVTRSPSMSDGGWRANIAHPITRFSEYQSPDPERVYIANNAPYFGGPEKEYYKPTPVVSVAASQPVPVQDHPVDSRKKPIYKRPLWVLGAFIVLAAIAVAVACGVVFGTKKHPTPSTDDNNNNNSQSNTTVINGDPDTAVGGYLNPSYYSTQGAFNGSGVALAAANPGVDQTIYIFYQDFQGQISWKLMEADGSYTQPLGIINQQDSRPLNGTPLSIVNYKLSDTNLVYHLFYIQDDFSIVERVLETGKVVSGSAVSVWVDGPLNAMNLKTINAKTIGLQACPWLNYYGAYSTNDSVVTIGLHLWYASSETQFQQFNWMNGSDSWEHERSWEGLDSHAGVGCQTWLNPKIEYVFFVDQSQKIAVFWKDYNRSAVATSSHPLNEWTQVKDIDISNVAKSSSLGYTTYMLYQAEDAAIRGANITWAAENTTVATSEETNSLDLFTIENLVNDEPVTAIKGTHMCITALKTASGGAGLQIFFQETGNDVALYTRDMKQVDGKWQKGPDVV